MGLYPRLGRIVHALADLGKPTIPEAAGTSPWIWVIGLVIAIGVAMGSWNAGIPSRERPRPMSRPAVTHGRPDRSTRSDRGPTPTRGCLSTRPEHPQRGGYHDGDPTHIPGPGRRPGGRERPGPRGRARRGSGQDPVPEGAETPSPKSLVFETIFTDGLAHLSYLIGDQETGRAAVIDPRRDVDVYLDLAREKGVVITHAIETHNHADFVSGCRELAVRSGTARVYLSVEGGMEYDFDHEPLHDGDTIDLGRVLLTARHTPGHTPEHLAYLFAEARRRDRPFGVFSGDCLFADSVGRPDLAGDDRSRNLAGQLFRSIREVFLKLEDGVRVHPAHGAGSPCGANIGDRLVTTIGYERRFNPALQLADEGKFVAFVLDSAPPEPTYYRRTKKVNARGPEVLVSLPTARPLHPGEFRKAAEGDVQLVDNRQMLAFGGGHIEGAMNIGPRPELSIWAGWMLDPDRPILLVLREDSDLSRVVTQLVRVGFTQFAGYLLGGMEAWANAGMPMRSVRKSPSRK